MKSQDSRAAELERSEEDFKIFHRIHRVWPLMAYGSGGGKEGVRINTEGLETG